MPCDMLNIIPLGAGKNMSFIEYMLLLQV